MLDTCSLERSASSGRETWSREIMVDTSLGVEEVKDGLQCGKSTGGDFACSAVAQSL